MIQIRVCNKDEVSDLQKLNNEVFIDNAQYDSDLELGWALSDSGKKYFTQLLNNEENICLIAESDGEKVGYLVTRPKHSNTRKSRYCEIENMGVSPVYRSQGIGSLLLIKCFEVAKANGFEKVFVTSYFGNTQAIDFYKKHNFKEIDMSLEMAL